MPALPEGQEGGEGAGESGRPTTAGASRATGKPETGKRGRWGQGCGLRSRARPGRDTGLRAEGAGLDWRRGRYAGGRRLGPRDARTDAARTRSQVSGGRETAGPGRRAATSAASPLPGMSEEPPRRLLSILGSAATPTSLGGGHSAHPGSPPSPPGASCCQPGPAPRSCADTTRARGRLSSDSRRRRLSARSRPPGRARDHTRTAIGCPAPGRAMCRSL